MKSQQQELQDAKQRRLIQEDLGRNIFVEAGAGSGKTTAMVARMVALLEQGKVEPSQLAAITFTNMAARHLKEKFQLALEERMRVEPHPLLEQAYALRHEMYVGTIHGFCQMMIEEFPLESGLSQGYSLMKKEDEEDYMFLSWQHTKSHLWDERSALLSFLQQCGLSLDHLDQIFMEIIKHSGELFPIKDIERPPASEVFMSVLSFARSIVWAFPEDEKNTDVFSYRMRNILALAEKDQSPMEEAAMVRELLQIGFFKEDAIKVTLWLNTDVAKDVKKNLWPDLKKNICDPFLRKWKAYAYAEVVRFLSEGLRDYAEQKRADNVVTLMDLLICAARMLRSHHNIRSYWQKRFQVFLVDEFQDTDPLQSEILLYLTSEDEGSDWTTYRPKAGSLFVVGDPKQSIYRFRGADVSMYNLMSHLMQSEEQNICELTSNFRSRTPIGTWVNAVFDRVDMFPKKASDYQAAFKPMLCQREALAEEHPHVFKMLTVDQKIEMSVADEASRVADTIAHEVRQGVSAYRDFMILGYVSKRLDVYAKACQDQGIPFLLTVNEDKNVPLLLHDLYRLLCWMQRPDDEYLGYAVLRSCFFGFSDDLLAKYRLHAKGRFICGALEDVSDEYVGIAEAKNIVRIWRQHFLLKPAVQVLWTWLEERAVFSLARQLPQGEYEANILAMFVEHCAVQEERRAVTLSDLCILCDTFLKTKTKELHGYEGQGPNVVRIMNVHQAKGLEASTVFLVNTGQPTVWKPFVHRVRRGAVSESYFSFKNFAEPYDWVFYEEKEAQHAKAEKQRLLYVAATRAKDRLIISCGKKNMWQDFAEHLENCPAWTLPATSGTRSSAFSQKISGTEPLKRDSDKAWLKLHIPSYTVQSISVATKNDAETFAYGQPGRGVVYGRVMHRILEQLAHRRKEIQWEVEPMVRWCCGQDVQIVQEDMVVALVAETQNFLASTLWQRMCQSVRLFVEVPLAVPMPKGMQSGVIDMIMQEGEGWVLVDYKTDLVVLDQHYAPQIMAYCEAWEKLSEEKVKEGLLYFTALQQTIKVR